MGGVKSVRRIFVGFSGRGGEWVEFCLLGVGRFLVLGLLFVAGFFSLEDNIPYYAI